MKEILLAHLSNLLNHVNEFNHHSITFNTQELPPLANFSTDIRQEAAFKNMFELLNTKKGFCIYWFECETPEIAFDLVNTFKSKKEYMASNKRTVPPINGNKNSNVLYVGVRQGGFRRKDGLTNISGRMIQHLGYYDKGSTGALQLVHWIDKSQSTQITLNVFELNLQEKEYLYIIEKLFAISLKPLLGKH
jgi:hypothetical protein